MSAVYTVHIISVTLRKAIKELHIGVASWLIIKLNQGYSKDINGYFSWFYQLILPRDLPKVLSANNSERVLRINLSKNTNKDTANKKVK